MGYRDRKLRLSESQSVSADADSTYYIDTEITSPGWEKGNPAAVIISVETAPGGTTGINFLICSHTAEPTNTHVVQTTKVLNADLVAGDQIVLFLPQGVATKRYLRIYYDLITGDETSAVLSAYFTTNPPPM